MWSPSPEYIERANVTRFMRAHGIATYEELVARSVDDVEWFWDAMVQDLEISFLTPALAVDEDPGDLSRLENPGSLAAIRDAIT